MLSSLHRAAALIATTLLCLSAASAADDAVETANAKAVQAVQQAMKERRIPGLQIAVVKHGRLLLSGAYGLANVENQVPASSRTLFPLNSATKPFTGVAMMQLAEAGLVDLGAPISRYLDDLPEAWRRIRVRQLLAHTSGLPDIVDPRGLIGGATEIEAWKQVKALPVAAPAGERFSYNQTNYGLLAQIVTKLTRMPFEQYLAREQFKPAAMNVTMFGDSYDLVPNAATIYSVFPRGSLAPDDATRMSRWHYEIPYGLWSGGGLQTTAEEVARWIIALSEGRLLKPASLKAMWTPEKLNNGTDGAWGAGWPVLQTSPQLQVAGIGGARAAFFVYPDEQLAIIVLTNLAGANPQSFIPQIAAFYKNLPAAAGR
ncbi:beta-lactamase family protein [Pelomonas sp. V22]|uniref:serine hydrolase domain-containing protein n=1 Tax=Pelomonas sp. V22 TaxID=2822139 RepID=UPI0024A97FC9|nr:serine hydrolase domain-containing protein [Pelomonas sp. V22]MDI4633648.1 beta-lactamase family protein [Pelomonas sp. V22]